MGSNYVFHISQKYKFTKRIRQLNDILISLCLVNDSYFISNDNSASHGGVHLNKDDTCTVARNVIHFRSPSHT